MSLSQKCLALLATALAAVAWSQPESAREQSTGFDADQPTVLITGSNRGIGLGFAQHYAEAGWNVIATTRTPGTADVLNQLAAQFARVRVEELDVLDAAELAGLAAKYAATPIDLLINNAAFHGGEPEDQQFGSFNFQTFQRYMAVNTFGPLAVSEAFYSSVAMSEQRRIVTLTTGLAILSQEVPLPGIHFQAISKAAANRAMRALQFELKQDDITVILMSPGRVLTDGLAAAGRAIQAGMPDGVVIPDDGPPPMTVTEAVSAMAGTIANVDTGYDGSHIDLFGNKMPW